MNSFGTHALGIAAAMLAGTVSAHAFDAQQFSPAVDPQGYYSIHSSKTAPRHGYSVAGWYSWAMDPVDDVIDDIHQLNIVGTYSVLDDLEVGLDLPLSMVESDFPGVDDGFGIDDLKIHGKWAALDRGHDALGVAVIPFVEVPTGDEDRLTSNGDVDWGVIGAIDRTWDRFRGSFNTGLRINDKPFDGDDESDEVPFGLGLGYLLRGTPGSFGGERRIELLGEIFGSTEVENFFDGELETPVEFLVGVRTWCERGFQGALGVGRGITDGVNSPDVRIVASFGYAWSPPGSVPAAPEPPPAPPAEKLVVTDEELITLEPIYFDFNKATIRPVSHAILDQVATLMTDKPTIKIRVEAHTDWIGSDSYNEALSQRRAKATVDYLVGKGIDPSRLDGVGLGETRPIASNETAEGRSRNRRSEFHVVR
jgi:outer membrane protein OmpA-like peptidoglycan-associated protein